MLHHLIHVNSESVLHQLPDGYVETDLNGNILKLNPAAEGIFKEKVKVLFGYNFPQLFEAHTQQELKEIFKKLLKHGSLTKQHVVFKIRGKIKHLEISSSLLYQNGKAFKVFNIIRDVTLDYEKQKETEKLAQRLQSSEKEANLGCFEYNETTGERWWSRHMFNVYGVDEKKGVPSDTDVIKLCHPEDLERFAAYYKKVKKDKSVYDIIHRQINNKGEIIWLKKKGEFTKNEFGHDIFFGTVQNVTGLYAAKEQIKQNSNFIKVVNQAQQILILDGSAEDILHKTCAYLAENTQSDAVYLYKNDNNENYYLRAHSSEELQHQLNSSPKVYNYRHAGLKDWYDQLKQEIIIDSGMNELESFQKSFMGRYGIKSMLLIPIHLDDWFYGFLGFDQKDMNREWSGIEKNILLSFAKKVGYFLQRADFLNELKQNLAIQKLQNAELQKKNNELDNFVYATFHDLRAPITNMLGLMDISVLAPEKKEAIYEKMDFMVRKLYGIVNEVGVFAKNLKQPVETQQVAYDEIVKVIRQVQEQNPDYKCKFSLNINGFVPVYTDKLRLSIIIKSFVQNAMFYAQQAKSPEVNIVVDLAPKKCVIKVENNGPIIDAKAKKEIFKMFTTLDNRSKGSGLGLYVANEAAVKINGKLAYVSRTGKTIFTAIIPHFNL